MVVEDEMKEKDAVKELKKRMAGEMESKMYEDDNLFCRFLKYQKFDIDSAEVMLRKHLEWREKFDVANISKFQEPEVIKKYYRFPMLGHDKEGGVVRYCPSGIIDWIGLLSSVKTEDMAKRFIFDIEEDINELKRQSEKLGKTVEKCTYILNAENISFAQATNKKVLLTSIFLIDLYQSNYPKRLKEVYVINASIYFTIFFSIVKNFMSSRLLKKVKIYSDDSYKEDLLKVIDADVLPECFGGNRTDPDGDLLCHSLLNQMGPIPETYYIHKNKRSLATLPDAVKITLTRATFHEVFLEVEEPGSYLEWEFEIKCRDVGFGLFYQEMVDGEEKMKELIPLQRTDTEECAENGMYRCEEAGRYVMVFDNSYSWVRAKEIYYKVKVVTPKEQESELIK